VYEEVFTLIEKHLQQVMAASLKHRDHAQNQTKSYQPYFSSILIRDDTDFAIDMSNGAVIQREDLKQDLEIILGVVVEQKVHLPYLMN